MSVSKFCRLCGQPLRFERGPQGYPWMACPRWPRQGPHWWSRLIAGEHDRLLIDEPAVETVLNFDAMTGERL